VPGVRSLRAPIAHAGGSTIEMPPTQPPYQLAVTERCISHDLDRSSLNGARPAEQAHKHPLLRKFYEKLAASPKGQETVGGLQANIVAYSLHAGRWRGLTWHDAESGIVWLLAGGLHRSGERDDSYPSFRRLDRDHLLPSETDYERVFAREGPAFAECVADDVAGLLSRARDESESTVEGLLNQRIGMRVRFETDGNYAVALCLALPPGSEIIPAEWLVIALAACFPEAHFDAILWERELAGADLPNGWWAFRLASHS
jgi:hypothetical protein